MQNNSEFEIEKEGVEDCCSICKNCPSSTFVVFFGFASYPNPLSILTVFLGSCCGAEIVHLCAVEFVTFDTDRRRHRIEG